METEKAFKLAVHLFLGMILTIVMAIACIIPIILPGLIAYALGRGIQHSASRNPALYPKYFFIAVAIGSSAPLALLLISSLSNPKIALNDTGVIWLSVANSSFALILYWVGLFTEKQRQKKSKLTIQATT